MRERILTNRLILRDIAPADASQLARVAQLTQRTNQLNLTTIRRSEAELQHLCATGARECLTVAVRDRFGKDQKATFDKDLKGLTEKSDQQQKAYVQDLAQRRKEEQELKDKLQALTVDLRRSQDVVGGVAKELQSAKLLGDRKTVRLAIPDVRPVMQMQINIDVDAADGTNIRDAMWITINRVPGKE